MSIPDTMTAAELAEYHAEYAAWLDAHEPAPVDPERYDRPMTPTEALWSARCRALAEQYRQAGRKRTRKAG